MNREELNEKLATKVMQLCQPPEPDGWWWKDDGNMGLEQYCRVSSWDPAGGNLKQLRECYIVVDNSWEHSNCGDRSRFVNDGKFTLKNSSLYLFDELTAWAVFNNPELVAEAILRAYWVR